ncbi:MAG: succinate dehydrogenase, cytochrome b556 subunit [Rhodocyclaceae bacterium]
MAEATVRKTRPKHLNVMQIRLPLPGVLSIFHRVSGAGLFLCLPLILFLFGASLGTPEQFETYRAVIANPLVKLVLLGLLWAYLHHFCAGIRFLFMDVHVGVDLPTARMSAAICFAVSLALTVIVGVKLW